MFVYEVEKPNEIPFDCFFFALRWTPCISSIRTKMLHKTVNSSSNNNQISNLRPNKISICPPIKINRIANSKATHQTANQFESKKKIFTHATPKSLLLSRSIWFQWTWPLTAMIIVQIAWMALDTRDAIVPLFESRIFGEDNAYGFVCACIAVCVGVCWRYKLLARVFYRFLSRVRINSLTRFFVCFLSFPFPLQRWSAMLWCVTSRAQLLQASWSSDVGAAR